MTDGDVGDSKQVEKQLSAAKRAELKLREDYARVLDTRAGRAVVWDILAKTRIYSTSFTQGDPHATSYFEGRRSLGLEILEYLLTVDRNSYNIMRAENAEGGRG